MSVRRAASVVAAVALLGGCVVGSGTASAGGKSSQASQSESADSNETKANRVAVDEFGDSDAGVDVQSLAVFNPSGLDFIGLSIGGRTLDESAARALQVFFSTKPRASRPQYRLVAFTEKPHHALARVRLYRVWGWRAASAKRVPCSRLRVEFDIDQASQIRVAVPRSCLGNVGESLRANATVWSQHPPEWRAHPEVGSGADVIPDEHTLTLDTR